MQAVHNIGKRAQQTCRTFCIERDVLRIARVSATARRGRSLAVADTDAAQLAASSAVIYSITNVL
jgi:hypothetical protein